MKYIGAHISASGGVENAPLNAHAIGAKAFAFFTKNQRQWFASAYTAQNIDLFKARCEEFGFSANYILPHSSYLINLGNPGEEEIKKSRQAFFDEMSRCEQLGLNRLNFHPGSHLNQIPHTLAAGYEIRTREAYEDTFQRFEEIVGFGYLRGMHINDSKKELSSRVDRHDSIGKGVMNLDLFSFIVNDPRFDDLPLILETPDETLWAEEIQMLYALIK